MRIIKMMNPVCLKFIKVIFMLWLMFVCAENEARCIERERQALLDFKAGLVDDYGILSSWRSQEDNRDCCHWKGVGCSNQTGHIQRLDIHGDAYGDEYAQRFLRGEIRKSLMELPQLKYLNLNSNDFTDTHIPEFIGFMSNLRYLDLSSCYFVGKIPSQFGSLSHLRYLDLSSNILEGSIPYQLGNLSNLLYLYLSENNFEGTIPSQLGKLSNLKELSLSFSYGVPIKIDAGSQWLSNLTSLTHLDLSRINLNSSHNWLQMIGKLPKLRELMLSDCSLSDEFILSLSPSKFNFSTSLAILDLSYNSFTPMIFQWLSNVSSNLLELDLSYSHMEGSISNDFATAMISLERLYLYDNSFKGEVMKSLRNICTLRSLDMTHCNLTENLSTIVHHLSTGCVRQSLEELSLWHNQITGTLPDLSMFPSLKTLSLPRNRLKGKIPESIGLPSQFESLDISSNFLEGGIPKSFGNTCTLVSLDLSYNSLTEELPAIIHHLSGCARYSLQELFLENNKINGTNGTQLLDFSIFPSLKTIRLSQNRLNGKTLDDFRFPSQLEDLGMNTNFLEGVITDSHFANLSKLKFLDLSDNSLALTFRDSWVPSFQLKIIRLRSCKLGPSFPKWLQTQNNLSMLDISNAGISDTVPEWFWVLSTMLHLRQMNISYNNLTGIIPNLPLRFTGHPRITLATNQFEGPIPSFLQRAESLDLSKNKFSDSTLFLCPNDTNERLFQIDLSNNQLFGQIPDCWSNFKSLAYLDLSNNNLSGEVPTSLGSALQLQALILRNNSLTGELPFSLRSCTHMVMLDLGQNSLSGLIPSWIGSSLQQLQMLSLRRNHFFGNLPLSLCYLTSIHLLDLSSNNLKGQIPKCFKNFTAMIEEKFSDSNDHFYLVNQTSRSGLVYYYDLIALLMWKGAEHSIKNDKLLLKGIDLSSNQFSEGIPTEIGDLVALVSLNLSRNNLTGKIPSEIGRLVSLEFLDLSRNHLLGLIPSSLAQIYRLSMLDLSYNHLSGKIPTGTQLQSFNASSYEENQDLCGLPLEKMCLEEPPQESLPKTEEDGDSLFSQTFYLSMGLGFFTGFWGVFGTILFNRSWRHAYFRFLNNLTGKIMSK